MTGVRPPEGYLGTAARITSGPAPELVEAGYALEIGDAPLLHRGLTLADLAHLVELVECGALTRDEAAPVGAVLLKLLDSPASEFPYDPVYGDAARFWAKIFGLNAARVFGVDAKAKRNELQQDVLGQLRMSYLEEGPEPSRKAYGWVVG